MSLKPSSRGIQFSESEVIKALNAANGHQRTAAETLKVSPAWISKWLRKKGYVPVIRWEIPDVINGSN